MATTNLAQAAPTKIAPFNVRILKRVSDLARKDAKTHNKSLDGITEKALIYFFRSLPKEERAKLYASLPSKWSQSKRAA